MNARKFRKLFLGKILFFPEFLDFFAELYKYGVFVHYVNVWLIHTQS